MLPAKHKLWLTFKWEDHEYYVTAPINDTSVYHLYGRDGDGHKFLGTGSTPTKLEDRVYEGKISMNSTGGMQ